VKLWDARTGQETLTLKGHTNAVMSVAFSPDGARLATGSNDYTVKLWDARTGQETLSLKGHTGSVTSVAFSPDGARLMSRDAAGKVLVWEIPSGRRLEEAPPAPLANGGGAPISPDGQWQAFAEGDLARLVPTKPRRDRDFWDEQEQRRKALAPVWHQEDAAAAEKAGAWFAAAWHLERLLRLNPKDEKIQERLRQARQKLK
jgi:hypothetical protein